MIFRGVLFFPLLNSKVNAGVFPFCVYQFQFTVTPRMYVGFFLSVSCQILHLEQSQSYSLVSHAPCNPDGRSSKNISVNRYHQRKSWLWYAHLFYRGPAFPLFMPSLDIFCQFSNAFEKILFRLSSLLCSVKKKSFIHLFIKLVKKYLLNTFYMVANENDSEFIVSLLLKQKIKQTSIIWQIKCCDGGIQCALGAGGRDAQLSRQYLGRVSIRK